MELIKIIDENGIETGEIIDRDIAHDKNLLHNEITVFVVNEKKEILLQKRIENKSFNPGKWGSCSGHVEFRETPIEAAKRELKEELGIENLKIISFYRPEIVLYKNNSHFTYFYYCICND